MLMLSGCSVSMPENTILPTKQPLITVVPTVTPKPHNHIPIENCDLKYSKDISIIESNGYSYYVEDNKIFSENITSGEKKVIAEVSNEGWWIITNLYIEDNYLYYFEGEYYRLTSHFFELRRINLDTLISEKLTDCCEVWGDKTDSDLREVVLYNGKIYLRCNYEFYCYDIETNTSKMIHNDVYLFHIFDDYIFYIEKAKKSFTIFKMSIDTYEKEIVRGTGDIYDKYKDGMYGQVLYSNFCFLDDSMFFTTRNPDSICKVFYLEQENFPGYGYYETDIVYSENEFYDEYLESYNGKLYFICKENNSYYLYTYDEIDEIKKGIKLNDMSSPYRSFIKGDYIYYSSESSGLVRSKL